MSTTRAQAPAPGTDIPNPSMDDLVCLALQRMRNRIDPFSKSPPPLFFPQANSLPWNFFTSDDWEEFGNLDTEHGRLTCTLARYPERSAPSACEDTLRNLLGQRSVLESWTAAVPVLQAHATAAVEEICKRQRRSLPVKGKRTRKSDFITVPVDYEVSKSASEISLHLWKRALVELATQCAGGCLTGSQEFLQIHAYLKDPIYGLSKSFDDQDVIFSRLLDSRFPFEKRKAEYPAAFVYCRQEFEWTCAQAAQESSYLANPLINKICLVHFQANHQLSYANVPLDSLARAEFSVPRHVLEVLQEMLEAAVANSEQACPIIPILVATRPSYSDQKRNLISIVDGNHRASAAMLLRFLATQVQRLLTIDREAMSKRLAEYCSFHGIGLKWHVDLQDVLDELLYSDRSQRFLEHILSHEKLVREFAAIVNIPALVVQEEDFLTICKQRSAGKLKPVLLHPFHQTLFNDDALPFVLPQKAGQTHGRPDVFKLLPLTPFGKSGGGVGDVRATGPLSAKLRQSMSGLRQGGPGLDIVA
ncbi:hypothetical protein F4806DRAFT_133228 [Annulohypoxylon nitens]|nr:hypothetical protein F4806DRAFT_133228 [Annulohypoxylon nitens]